MHEVRSAALLSTTYSVLRTDVCAKCNLGYSKVEVVGEDTFMLPGGSFTSAQIKNRHRVVGDLLFWGDERFHLTVVVSGYPCICVTTGDRGLDRKNKNMNLSVFMSLIFRIGCLLHQRGVFETLAF